jgi:hypothetical protein
VLEGVVGVEIKCFIGCGRNWPRRDNVVRYRVLVISIFVSARLTCTGAMLSDQIGFHCHIWVTCLLFWMGPTRPYLVVMVDGDTDSRSLFPPVVNPFSITIKESL